MTQENEKPQVMDPMKVPAVMPAHEDARASLYNLLEKARAHRASAAKECESLCNEATLHVMSVASEERTEIEPFIRKGRKLFSQAEHALYWMEKASALYDKAREAHELLRGEKMMLLVDDLQDARDRYVMSFSRPENTANEPPAETIIFNEEADAQVDDPTG